MLDKDNNENGFKTNRSNQQKNKLHVQHTFSSNQQKTNLHMQHPFLSFPCRRFARLQSCFVRLKRQTSQLHIIFMELSYVLTQYFVPCVHVHFYFSLPLIFTQLAASIAHFLTAALNFHVFLPRNSSPLFLVTRSSCFSVIHVCVNIKNNAEKDTTLLLFFLSNSPSRHVISFQIKP